MLTIIGAPTDFGACRRGTDMGPSALRYTHVQRLLQGIGWSVTDLGNVTTPIPESLIREVTSLDTEAPQLRSDCDPSASPRQLFHLDLVHAFSEELAKAVADVCKAGRIPLVLGGDHSISIGTVAGLASCNEPFGLIWVDAHADFNTPETSPSGNIHGMSLAVAAGVGHPLLTGIGGIQQKVQPKHMVIYGARSIDHPEEARLLSDHGVRVITMREIDQVGAGAAMSEAIRWATADGRQRIMVSFDMDVVDPMHAPGVGTPVPGGLTYREAHLAMEMLYDSGSLMAFELAEVNPILDEGNRTASLAVDLCLSVFGKRIFLPPHK